MRVGNTTHARAVALPIEGDALDGPAQEGFAHDAINHIRGRITPVPGRGPIRGIVWFEGQLRAWRDDVDQGRSYRSTPEGWLRDDLGQLLYFVLGGPYEIQQGDVIVGSQSGATAKVRRISTNPDGVWADKKASGVLVLDLVTGIFGDEVLNVGPHLGIARITDEPITAVWPLGGRYEFDVFNFYGSTGTERAYGANGVGPAFEFDGNSITPILSGMEDDRPFLVRAHKYHLFLGFPRGSLQHSRLGEPTVFDARLGAAEIGLGRELTSLTPNASNVLLVTTDTSIAALTGNDASDWQLEGLSDEAGAKRFTSQRIGQVIYLDNRGVRNIAATAAYGNFEIGTYTSLISAELERKRLSAVVPVASCVVKRKDQYLLFFSDGTGISIYFGRKKPEAMLFEYPFVVSCLYVVEVDGVERVFAGAEDGYCYELNKGTSFDGQQIPASLVLPFAHQGDPRSLKRYHKAALEVVAPVGTRIGCLAQFDYGSDYQPFPHEGIIGLAGGGALWDIGNWDEFIWSAPSVARAEMYLQGVGSNMSLLIRSESATMQSYVVQGVTLMFSPRGRMR